MLRVWNDGAIPLHYAAYYGQLHIVKYLTDEQGCNLSCKELICPCAPPWQPSI